MIAMSSQSSPVTRKAYKMRYNGSGSPTKAPVIPSISVEGPDEPEQGSDQHSYNAESIQQNMQDRLSDIFSVLYRKRSSSMRSDSGSCDMTSSEGVHRKGSPLDIARPHFVAAPTQYGMSGDRVPSLEEELQDRLKYVNELATMWQRRCKQERDENIRMRDQFVLCEAQCKDMIEELSQEYQGRIAQLSEYISQLKKQQDKFIEFKSSIEKDHALEIKILEFHKNKLKKQNLTLEMKVSDMSDLLQKHELKITNLNTALQEKEKRINDIESLACNIELMEESTSALEDRVSVLTYELTQTSRENRTLRTQNSMYKKENDRVISDMVKERRHAEHSTKDLHNQLSTLSERLTAAENKARTLQEENNCLQISYGELSGKYQKLEIKHLEAADVTSEAQCNYHHILLDIALNKLAYMEELHAGVRQHSPASASPMNGTFRLVCDEKNLALMQVEQLAVSEGEMSGDGTDVMSVYSDQNNEENISLGSASDVHRAVQRRTTPPPPMSPEFQRLNRVSLPPEKRTVRRVKSADGRKRNVSVPVLMVSPSEHEKSPITDQTHSGSSLHVNIPSPLSSTKSSPAASPQSCASAPCDTARVRSNNRDIRRLKSRSLSESESEVLLACFDADEPDHRSSEVLHDPLKKADRFKLRKRSVSEKDLHANLIQGSQGILHTISNGHLRAQTMSFSTENLASTRCSGFEGLRNRRNGIIDLPRMANKPLRTAKKSKPGDFFFRKSPKDTKESPDSQGFDKKAQRKRSWKLKH